MYQCDICAFAGMVSFKDSISRKRQIDMGKKKCMNGVVVTTYLLQMGRVWKCVPKELSRILESK